MTAVTVHHAKTSLSRLFAEALRGEDVVIAKGSVPVVRLIPVEGLRPRRPGSMKGKIALTPAFFEPLPSDEVEAWEGGNPIRE